MAIHRIPSRQGQVKPTLIKLKNNNDKSTIMRKRKEMKQEGHRLVDDVTYLNTGLMNRLSLHAEMQATWFYNGTVYGLTHRNERIQFDLYDSIDNVISEKRSPPKKDNRS